MARRGFWASERSLTVLLVVTVLSIFVIGPSVRPSGVGSVVLTVTYFAILVSGIASVASSRIVAIGFSMLALACVVAWGLSLYSPGDAARAGRTISSAAFCLLLAIVVFHHVFFQFGRVTLHRVSGSVAAYILIGLFFAFVYDSIESLVPGSFSFATAGARNLDLNDPMAYFSFTTLTTVGYGDVTPLTPLTQSLTNIEALIGQLFPVILISRLVALEVMPHADGSDGP